MSNKPRVLLAARPLARAPFRDALQDDVEFVEAETIAEAVDQVVRNEPQLVCSTIYFDESRMFDLLRWIRSERSHIPVVCARALPKDLNTVSMEAVRIASTALGAASFVDVPELIARHGPDEAHRQLRSLLLAQLPPGAA